MNDHRLLICARREERILELLRERSVMSVADLSETLEVSEATVRRCLQTMHDRGLLRRVHGGATLRALAPGEPMFQDKESRNRAAKERIARTAFELIEDHDRIYLDGGSTVLMLARLLDRCRELTIVTNSLIAASELMTTRHRLVLVGGEFRALSRTLVGPLTASVIQTIHVNKAFMGTIGFTVQDGMTTTDANEAFTKEQIMGRADQVVLLADSSKIGVTSFARSGTPGDVDILVTEAMAAECREAVEDLGIQILIPPDDTARD